MTVLNSLLEMVLTKEKGTHWVNIPLFLADRVNTISVLLDNGANVDERNRLNQTPLISYLCRSGAETDIINFYLERGADINARDKYGSSALHYAAWHGVGQDIVRSLKVHGAKLQPDSLNQMPCHVAYWHGSKRIFDYVCICKGGLHKGTEHFNFQTRFVNISELDNSNLVLVGASQHFEVFRERNIARILHMPGFELVRFDGEAETADIKSAVTECIRKFCEEVENEDKWLTCTLIQSGSVSERTKVGLPDEFDFVCRFDKISEVCYIDEQKSSTDPGFVYLKLKPEYSNLDCNDLFDKDGYLDTVQVRSRFLDILQSKLKYCTIFCNPNLTYLRNHMNDADIPIFHFALQWIGAFYKNLVIDIDMVPACQIKGFWPEKANLNSLECDIQELTEEGSLLILKTEHILGDPSYGAIPNLRISALRAEKRHIQSLPVIAKDAYVVSKIICNERICPILLGYEKAKDLIPSYILKTCMFHVYHTSVRNKDESMNDISTSDEDRYNDALYKYVCRIYQTLLKFSEDEVLQSFIFPWQNVFTFALKEMDELLNHSVCVKRQAYAKMILNILGENNHFRNIDKSDFLVRNMSDYDSSDDSNTFELSD